MNKKTNFNKLDLIKKASKNLNKLSLNDTIITTNKQLLNKLNLKKNSNYFNQLENSNLYELKHINKKLFNSLKIYNTAFLSLKNSIKVYKEVPYHEHLEDLEKRLEDYKKTKAEAEKNIYYLEFKRKVEAENKKNNNLIIELKQQIKNNSKEVKLASYIVKTNKLSVKQKTSIKNDAKKNKLTQKQLALLCYCKKNINTLNCIKDVKDATNQSILLCEKYSIETEHTKITNTNFYKFWISVNSANDIKNVRTLKNYKAILKAPESTTILKDFIKKDLEKYNFITT